MTAVEWLMSQLPLGFKMTIAEKLEEAREMEKQQMCKIYEGILQNVGTSIKQNDLPTFEQYYNETYGSDEIKKAEEMGLYDKIELSNPNDSIFTSSQTEISDEEIEKKAMDILKDKWSHLYSFGYPKKPFPINYQQDLAMVMLGIYKSQRMRFHCVPKEISDEEIEKEILHRPMTVLEERAFRSACKWYREQLKKK